MKKVIFIIIFCLTFWSSSSQENKASFFPFKIGNTPEEIKEIVENDSSLIFEKKLDDISWKYSVRITSSKDPFGDIKAQYNLYLSERKIKKITLFFNSPFKDLNYQKLQFNYLIKLYNSRYLEPYRIENPFRETNFYYQTEDPEITIKLSFTQYPTDSLVSLELLKTKEIKGPFYKTKPEINLLKKIKTNFGEWNLNISPNGEKLLSGGDRINQIYFRNKNGKELWSHTFNDSTKLESAALSKDGKYIAIGAQKGFVSLFNKKGKELWRKKVKGEVQVAITQNGNKILAIGSSGHILYCYSTEGDLIFSKRINNRNWGTWSLSITPNANRILVGTNSDIIILNQNGTVLNHYDIVQGNHIARGTLSPDGKYFAYFMSELDEKTKIVKHLVVCSDINNNIQWKTITYYPSFQFDRNNNLYIGSRTSALRIHNIKGELISGKFMLKFDSLGVTESGKTIFGTTTENIEVYNNK